MSFQVKCISKFKLIHQNVNYNVNYNVITMLILTIYKTIITINYWDVNYDDEIFKSINYLTSLMCLIVL